MIRQHAGTVLSGSNRRARIGHACGFFTVRSTMVKTNSCNVFERFLRSRCAISRQLPSKSITLESLPNERFTMTCTQRHRAACSLPPFQANCAGVPALGGSRDPPNSPEDRSPRRRLRGHWQCGSFRLFTAICAGQDGYCGVGDGAGAGAADSGYAVRLRSSNALYLNS